MDEVLKQVLLRIVPSEEEKQRIYSVADQLRNDLCAIAENEGLKAEIILGGSVAKSTWIKDEADIDLFMLVPPTLNREEIKGFCLDIARKAVADNEYLERYAEHPYIEDTKLKLRFLGK